MLQELLRNILALSGAKACKYCRSRQELSNESLLAKIGFDAAENEPRKVSITDFADHIFRQHAECLGQLRCSGTGPSPDCT